MDLRVGKTPPIDISDGIVNIFTNYIAAYAPSIFSVIPYKVSATNNIITPTIEFDCAHYSMVAYRKMCATSPACENAVATWRDTADTLCGICYKYNNPDNPVYEVNTKGLTSGSGGGSGGSALKSLNKDISIRLIAYLLRRMHLKNITYDETFRELIRAIYILTDLFCEQIAQNFEPIIKINDLRDAITSAAIRARYVREQKNIILKNQMYELIGETLATNQYCVAQLRAVTLLYTDLYVKFNVDNKASEPYVVHSVDTPPWTARENIYGIRLANEYWDTLDIARIVRETDLSYPNNERRSIFTATSNNMMPLLLIFITYITIIYRSREQLGTKIAAILIFIIFYMYIES
jgi:hypothetical protein